MQLCGILFHSTLESIARAAIAAMVQLRIICGIAVIVFSVELFFVFEFFSFVKHFSFL